MDAFVSSVCGGLVYKNATLKKRLFISGTYGIMQALMPLACYWIIEGLTKVINPDAVASVERIISLVLVWLAFVALLIIGGKMIIDGTKGDNKTIKDYSIKTILVIGVITSIDAFASGIELRSSLSNNVTVWLHVVIICAITFILSLVGLYLGKQIQHFLKGKLGIANIVGGLILIGLAIYSVIAFYVF